MIAPTSGWLDEGRHQQQYVLQSSIVPDTERRRRRPRNHARDASPPRQYRPGTFARGTGENSGSDRDDHTDDDRRHQRQRHTRTERYEGREREDRYRVDHRADTNSSSGLQGMTSWLERLGLLEDDDSYVSDRTRDAQYPYPVRPDERQNRDGRDRRSSASSASLSPSRSFPPRRRAMSPYSSRGKAVARHGGYRDRDRTSERGRGSSDLCDHYERRDGYSDDHSSRSARTPQQRTHSASGQRSSRDGRDGRRPPPRRRSPPSSKSSSGLSAWEMAARNALRAGTMAALTNHSAPGSWLGNKGTRVATAALGAALVDTYMGHRHPESVNGVRHTAMRQAAEYAISNIVTEPILQHAARRRTRR